MDSFFKRYKLKRPVLAPTEKVGDFDSKEVDCAQC